jgi:ubiquitin carboxyl-terminal hydrolase 34
MIEGEIINDFLCEGCNTKVDIMKRTLISQTPNVLIVHLQRICFDFDTYQNDKINSYFEFPDYLDLSPYSFAHITKGEKEK